MVPRAGRPPRLRSAPLYVSRPAPSKRVWADDFPAVALEEFAVFVGVARAALRKILKEAAGSGRGVEKQRARAVSLLVFFQACGTSRGMNAQVPGPPTVTSSPI